MYRIAVFDDNIDRRNSLKMLLDLSSDLEFVGAYENCENIEQRVETTLPDIILMDIEMPGKDGIYGVQKIQKSHPYIKVIMQTVFEDSDKIFQCLQYGAKGYILKSASVQEILDCIMVVSKGGAFMTPSVALKVMQFFQQKSAKTPDLETLTPKELEVLKLLSEGLSYKLIADKLSITAGTVNNHLKKVYEKLHVHSAGEAISLMYKSKLI